MSWEMSLCLFKQLFWTVPINTCMFLIVHFTFCCLSDFVHILFSYEVLYLYLLKWLTARNCILYATIHFHEVQLQTCAESTSIIQAGTFLKLVWIYNGLKMIMCLILLLLLPLQLRVIRYLYWKSLHLTKELQAIACTNLEEVILP